MPFATLYGDYTVLMFNRCDQESHGPAARLLKDIVAENRHALYVDVTGVDVHWSDNGCPVHKQCHLVSDRSDLASLCDANGVVRRLYGAAEENAIHVIGPDGRVLAAAPQAKAADLLKQLRKAVSALSRERYEREYPQTSDQ